MHPKFTIDYSRRGNTNKYIYMCSVVKTIQKIKNRYKKVCSKI